MTTEQLHKLIAQGEGQMLEFKKSVGRKRGQATF